MASRRHIDILPGADFFIFAALALLVLPLKWLIAAAFAAIFHECSHYLALRLCGVRIFGVNVGMGGAELETEAMSDTQELICALAGPAGSFLLFLMVRLFPELGICGGIQGMYNLLPLFPLDGGRAVRSILGLICPQMAERVFVWIQRGTVTLIVLAAVFAFRYLGYSVVLAVILLLRKPLRRKIPCKAAPERVQ